MPDMSTQPERLTVVALYPWWKFWVMDEGEGSPSFFLSPNAFAEAGHRIIVVMPRGRGLPARETYHGMELVRYRGGPKEVIDDPLHSRLWRLVRRQIVYWCYHPAAFIAGLRVIRRERPDVIISYGEHSPQATWLLGKLTGLPTINRLFGTNLGDALGNVPHLLFQYIELLAILIPARRLVIVNDGSEGYRVARHFGVPHERIRFLFNGMDHSLYDPETPKRAHREALGLPLDGMILYTTSRFHPQKHVERILAALPEVFAAHPSTWFLLIGDGPEREFLVREIARLGIGERVIMPGAIDQANLKPWINASDLFVAMSDRTNAANPLFEAMVAGRPGVVLDTGSTGDVIDHDVNGWLVPRQHPERLAAVLNAVVGDSERLHRVGAAARRWAVENIPTWKARQRMEVDIVVEAVQEWRAQRG